MIFSLEVPVPDTGISLYHQRLMHEMTRLFAGSPSVCLRVPEATRLILQVKVMGPGRSFLGRTVHILFEVHVICPTRGSRAARVTGYFYDPFEGDGDPILVLENHKEAILPHEIVEKMLDTVVEIPAGPLEALYKHYSGF
jgi:hypothetical protein